MSATERTLFEINGILEERVRRLTTRNISDRVMNDDCETEVILRVSPKSSGFIRGLC